MLSVQDIKYIAKELVIDYSNLSALDNNKPIYLTLEVFNNFI